MKRTILVIGSIQVGKSSFIRSIYKYAGVEIPDELKIGNGNVSCTRTPTVYNLPLKFITRELSYQSSVSECNGLEFISALMGEKISIGKKR